MSDKKDYRKEYYDLLDEIEFFYDKIGGLIQIHLEKSIDKDSINKPELKDKWVHIAFGMRKVQLFMREKFQWLNARISSKAK